MTTARTRAPQLRLAGRSVSLLGLFLLCLVSFGPFSELLSDANPHLRSMLFLPPPLAVLAWFGGFTSLVVVLLLALSAIAFGPGVSRGNAIACRYSRDIVVTMAALMAAGVTLTVFYQYQVQQLFAPWYAARGLEHGYDYHYLSLLPSILFVIGLIGGSLALARLSAREAAISGPPDTCNPAA